MNIRDAKEQVKHAVIAYLSKDDFGDYRIPIDKQRPVFLYGVPGIGKTAIMEQIAQEMNIGLVAYSMTHHTRQSALGLPFIAHKIYDGKAYDVSEYTMSEIIATIYETMEASGVKEGILFLDELNCVSETLAPAMLQFLQFKIFGRHKVPDGWVVVTAGNPPEYNKSVREFDIVTMDRMKKIDIEPNFKVWKAYAYKEHVHGAIISYLDIKNNHFYSIETTLDGKNFVTARGWEDLSKMMILYESSGIAIDENLVIQYLQNARIAKDFAVYYDLYNKYKSDYQISEILDGKTDEVIKERARSAKFDERLSLMGLLLETVTHEMGETIALDVATSELYQVLKDIKHDFVLGQEAPEAILERFIKKHQQMLNREKLSGAMSLERKTTLLRIIQALEGYKNVLKEHRAMYPEDAFGFLKTEFESQVALLKAKISKVHMTLKHLFGFVDEVFGTGNEILILVTELTVHYHSAKFIGKFGCKEYFEHNKELLFYERQQEIIGRIDALELDSL